MLMAISGGLDPSPLLTILKNKTGASSTMKTDVINSATCLPCHTNATARDCFLDYARRGAAFHSQP